MSDETWNLIKASRKVVNDIIDEKQCIYGINTGFGKFATTVIPENQLEELQINLIRSHSSGIGDYLSTKHVRMLMALRINVLGKLKSKTIHVRQKSIYIIKLYNSKRFFWNLARVARMCCERFQQVFLFISI